MRTRFLSLLLLLAVGLACSRPRAVPRSPRPVPVRPPVARSPLARLGHTVQVGAFAEVENAARLAASLQAQGLDATYYRSPQGLFRVRFGDFPTREAARTRADALRAAGVIQAYYLPRPDEPTVAPLPPADDAELRRNLAATALSFQGVPYLWGGTTDQGFDCSGLAMAVYRLNGLRLPRTSQAQFEAGSEIDLEDARAGDLVFFAMGRSGRVSHVGICLGDGRFVHAPGSGRTITVADLGSEAFSSRLAGVRRYV